MAANAGTQFDPLVVRAITALPVRDLQRVAGIGAWMAAIPMGNGLRRAARAGRPAANLALGAIVLAVAVVSGLLPRLHPTVTVRSVATGPGAPASTPPTPTPAATPGGARVVPFELFPAGSAAPPATPPTAPPPAPVLAATELAAASTGPLPPAPGPNAGAAPAAAAAAISPATSSAAASAPPPPPQAVADAVSTPAGAAVVIAVLANDQLGSPVAVNLAAEPSHGRVRANADGTLTYTPGPGYLGGDLFSYGECDRNGRCSLAPVTVTVVAPVPPQAAPVQAVATSGVPEVVLVLANDRLAGPVTVTIAAAPAHGAAAAEIDGTASYTSMAGYVGPDSFSYEVCDAVGQCSSSTVAMTVQAPPPPVARDDAVATLPGAPVIIDVEANDAAPAGSTLAVSSAPAHGTAAVVGGRAVSYQPAPAFTGSDSLSYRICDGFAQCATASVSVAVSPLATAQPVAVDDSAVVVSDATVAVPVLGNDPGPWVTTTLSVAVAPAHGTATPVGDGTVTYRPAAGYGGADSFGYLVCDPSARCATASVTVGVLASAPTGPVAVGDLAVGGLAAGGSSAAPVTVAVLADDLAPGGAPATVASVGLPAVMAGQGPAHGSVATNGDGTMTYIPDAGFSGVDQWVYQVCAGACASAAVVVAVPPPSSAPGLAPVTRPGAAVAVGGGAVTVAVLADDHPGSSGAALVPSTVAADPSGPAPAHGTVVFGADGSATYTPASGYSGPDGFGYQVCDAAARCSSSVVVVTVVG